jgi:hypothetical protein
VPILLQSEPNISKRVFNCDSTFKFIHVLPSLVENRLEMSDLCHAVVACISNRAGMIRTNHVVDI